MVLGLLISSTSFAESEAEQDYVFSLSGLTNQTVVNKKFGDDSLVSVDFAPKFTVGVTLCKQESETSKIRNEDCTSLGQSSSVSVGRGKQLATGLSFRVSRKKFEQVLSNLKGAQDPQMLLVLGGSGGVYNVDFLDIDQIRGLAIGEDLDLTSSTPVSSEILDQRFIKEGIVTADLSVGVRPKEKTFLDLFWEFFSVTSGATEAEDCSGP